MKIPKLTEINPIGLSPLEKEIAKFTLHLLAEAGKVPPAYQKDFLREIAAAVDKNTKKHLYLAGKSGNSPLRNSLRALIPNLKYNEGITPKELAEQIPSSPSSIYGALDYLCLNERDLELSRVYSSGIRGDNVFTRLKPVDEPKRKIVYPEIEDVQGLKGGVYNIQDAHNGGRTSIFYSGEAGFLEGSILEHELDAEEILAISRNLLKEIKPLLIARVKEGKVLDKEKLRIIIYDRAKSAIYTKRGNHLLTDCQTSRGYGEHSAKHLAKMFIDYGMGLEKVTRLGQTCGVYDPHFVHERIISARKEL